MFNKTKATPDQEPDRPWQPYRGQLHVHATACASTAHWSATSAPTKTSPASWWCPRRPSVTGAIHADHIIINGHVNGPVHAHVMLELQPKARIEGDVHYRALEMHQGAIISGQMRPRGRGRGKAHTQIGGK